MALYFKTKCVFHFCNRFSVQPPSPDYLQTKNSHFLPFFYDYKCFVHSLIHSLASLDGSFFHFSVSFFFVCVQHFYDNVMCRVATAMEIKFTVTLVFIWFYCCFYSLSLLFLVLWPDTTDNRNNCVIQFCIVSFAPALSSILKHDGKYLAGSFLW